MTPGTFDANGNPSPTAAQGRQHDDRNAGLPALLRSGVVQHRLRRRHVAPATNTEVGIFTIGDNTIAIADFRDTENHFGMPQVPINTIHVQPPSSDITGNGEWTLDMTYAQGMAYNVKQLDLYNAATFSFKDMTVAFNRWVSDDVAPVLNASVGGCEAFPYISGDMLVGDMILVEAAAQGQTLFASTGDTGAYCGAAGVPPNGGVGGVPMVEYPAASPYAVAVGGTDLFSNVDGTYLGEDAWQSGGGGVSQFEYSPYWEQGVQPVGTTPAGLHVPRHARRRVRRGPRDRRAHLAGRRPVHQRRHEPGLADGGGRVGAHAERARQRAGLRAAAALQDLRAQHAAADRGPAGDRALRTVPRHPQGTNGLYTALPKYDYTTGLGSIDIARLAAAIGRSAR